MSTNKSAPLLLLLLSLLLVRPPTADAATYTVHSCKTPSGAWVGAEGWREVSTPPVVGYGGGSYVGCDSSPVMELSLGSGLPVASGTQVNAVMTAPDNTSIVSFQMHRGYELGWPVSTGSERPYAAQVWHGADESTRLFDFRAPLGRERTLRQASSLLDAGAIDSDRVTASLRCSGLAGTGACGSFPATLTIDRATFELRDVLAPTLTSSWGAARVRGVVGIGFDAADAGGGVYRSILELDGAEVARTVINENGGRCGDVEPATVDPYEFAAPLPCPLAAAGSVEFDSATLTDGTHTLTLRVEDAAGNLSTALQRTVTSHNAPISISAPWLGGDPRVGGVVSTEAGGWDGAPDAFDYRWLRCDAAGANCAAIAGASGPQYAPIAADAYHRLVAEVVAGNPSGSAVARSAPSDLVADADGRTAPDTTRRPAGHGPDDGGDGNGDGRSGPDGSGGPAAAGAGGGGAGGVAGIPSLQNPLGDQAGRAPNGSGASARARVTLALRRTGGGSASRVRSAINRRWTVVGRLTDGSGRAIEGARLNVLRRVAGRRWVARGLVRTGPGGRFTQTLPGGPSRTVRVTYFPFGDSDAFRSSNTVAIDVLAPLTIKTDRRILGTRRTVTISGRAGGGSIPAGGLLVTLQGYQHGYGWRTFRTIRTTRSGAWRTSYRFRAVSGRFAFRALVPQQGRYPFVTTTSRSVPVMLAAE